MRTVEAQLKAAAEAAESVEREAAQRREARKTTRRTVLPAVIATAQTGDALYFVPPKATHERYGQRVTVLRPPRRDVKVPSLRVRFPDGTEQRVPGRQLRPMPVRAPEPAFLIDARTRPAWTRLVRALRDGAPETDTDHRSRQLAGMVAPKGSPASTTVDVPRVLLDAARAEARHEAQRQPQRGGRGQPEPLTLAPPTQDLAELRLDQDQRALVNRIALSIHRRYLLSDKEVRAITAREREEGQIHSALHHLIGKAQKDTGHAPPEGSSGPRKGSALHGTAHDGLVSAYQLALEACELVLQQRFDDAYTLAFQARQKKLEYLAAQTALNRRAVTQSTGRYFHGDILSVRIEHEDLDEHGRRVAYHGMTQFYCRLIVVHLAGHAVQVVNSAELESITGTRAGPQAWASLARWIEDHSSRGDGRRQGRRQDDDAHLIYRLHEERLRLRDGLEKYPDLLLAFEVIRRALYVDLPMQDITDEELGTAPEAGFHAPDDRGDEEGLDKTPPEFA